MGAIAFVDFGKELEIACVDQDSKNIVAPIIENSSDNPELLNL